MSSSMSETNTLYEACSTFDHTFYRVHENIAKTNDLRRLLHALDIKSKDQVQLEETTNIINKKLTPIDSSIGPTAKKLARILFKNIKTNGYLTGKNALTRNEDNCRQILEDLKSEYETICENENYTDDIKTQLIYVMCTKLDNLDQKLLGTLAETAECMNIWYQANYEAMVGLTGYIGKLRTENLKKLMLYIPNRPNPGTFSIHSSLNLITSMRSLSSYWNETLFKQDFTLNLSDIPLNESLNYEYSRMDEFFETDFSISMINQDEPNLIIFKPNQTNIKTFTNNRVLIGSRKKDFISIVNI